MLDNIISKFGDRELTKTRLENNDALRNMALEFCATFKNVSVCASLNSQSLSHVDILMDNGLHAGSLYVTKDYNGEFYQYTSDVFVSKQKATGRANKQTRDSKTITGLIKAVTKNKEWPQYDGLYRSFRRGLSYAFNATCPGRPAQIDLSSELAGALVVSYIEKTDISGQYDATLLAKYDELMRKRREYMEGADAFKRFAKGCKVVAISQRTHAGPHTYYVGNVSATLDSRGGIQDINLIHFHRYDFISECDLVAADMAIIKTYMQDKIKDAFNPLHIPFADKYYPEIDIATGYDNREMLWVLIPHEA